MIDPTAYIHAYAIVENGVVIGEKTRVWAFAHILSGAQLGAECNICDHTFIENDVKIGNRVTVKSGVYLWDGLEIANDVFIGPCVTFANDKRPRSKVYLVEFPKTYLKEGCSIGANATILPGLEIGKWSMVGAGSVVTKNVPAYALVYGNPAKIMSWICSCTVKLIFNEQYKAQCSCGKIYSLNNDSYTIAEDKNEY